MIQWEERQGKALPIEDQQHCTEEKMHQMGFFELGESYTRLEKAGDPLAKMDKVIDWASLRPILKPISYEAGKKGGRPAWDALVIVKCLILQALYNIADGNCEYQINDRISFKRFLGLDIAEKAPDEKTIWLYRERIKELGLYDKIFSWFEGQLVKAGYEAKKGQIIDAAFVETHKPTSKHKKQAEPLRPAQERQIDKEATFTKKREETYHGYKNHIQIDAKNKLIRRQRTTTASRHDSQEFQALVDPTGNSGRDVSADSAYRSAESEQFLKEHKLRSRIHYRPYRGKPLSETKKKANTTRSKVRARVEHVFGYISTCMKGFEIHTIGLARATVKVTFKNLTYNIQRFVFLQMQRSQAKCA